MDLALKDKVVLITGASGGIGRAMAEAFAEEGAHLALHGHRQWDELQAWVQSRPWRDQALPLHADITNASEVASAIAKVRQRWGRLDVCVANAGIWPPESLPLHELSEERIRSVLSINLLGAVWTARAFLSSLAATGPRQRRSRGGAAVHRLHRRPLRRARALRLRRQQGGFGGLMMSLKNEIVALDPYARVNVIEPGWTVTDMTRRNIHEPGVVERVVQTMPVRQLARAADIARTALFLASPVASPPRPVARP